MSDGVFSLETLSRPTLHFGCGVRDTREGGGPVRKVNYR